MKNALFHSTTAQKITTQNNRLVQNIVVNITINKSLVQFTECKVQSAVIENLNTIVIPAKAGIHCVLLNFEIGWNTMDPGLRRGDDFFFYSAKRLFIAVTSYLTCPTKPSAKWDSITYH